MDLPTLVIFGGFALEDGGGGGGGGGGGVKRAWEREGVLFYSLGHEEEWRRVNAAAANKEESSSSLSTPRAFHVMFVHQSKAQGRFLVVHGGQHSGMV